MTLHCHNSNLVSPSHNWITSLLLEWAGSSLSIQIQWQNTDVVFGSRLFSHTETMPVHCANSLNARLSVKKRHHQARSNNNVSPTSGRCDFFCVRWIKSTVCRCLSMCTQQSTAPFCIPRPVPVPRLKTYTTSSGWWKINKRAHFATCLLTLTQNSELQLCDDTHKFTQHNGRHPQDTVNTAPLKDP